MYHDPRIVKVAGYRPTAKMATLIHILFVHIQISLTSLVPKYKNSKEYIISSEASQADFNLNKEY